MKWFFMVKTSRVDAVRHGSREALLMMTATASCVAQNTKQNEKSRQCVGGRQDRSVLVQPNERHLQISLISDQDGHRVRSKQRSGYRLRFDSWTAAYNFARSRSGPLFDPALASWLTVTPSPAAVETDLAESPKKMTSTVRSSLKGFV